MQTAEENRSDSNLILLCRKHHAWVDQIDSIEQYSTDLLRNWKVTQELQGENRLSSDDIIAIQNSNINIVSDSIHLGGFGGAAPGAGGGGGGAIGENARGGDGGHGGRTFYNDVPVSPTELHKHYSLIQLDQSHPTPGAGGAGSGVTGDNSCGGRGGDGGDVQVWEGKIPAGQYRINVGRGSFLPGEFGQPTYLEHLGSDGEYHVVGPIAQGGMSGDSYLPAGIAEVDKNFLKRGFVVNCIAPHDGLELDEGVFSIRRLGWSWLKYNIIPTDMVINVVVLAIVPRKESAGFYVSLMLENTEVARQAVVLENSLDSAACLSSGFSIGAEVKSLGKCRLIAHGSGIILNETSFEII